MYLSNLKAVLQIQELKEEKYCHVKIFFYISLYNSIVIRSALLIMSNIRTVSKLKEEKCYVLWR